MGLKYYIGGREKILRVYKMTKNIKNNKSPKATRKNMPLKRVETDSLGKINVLADRYWGAQTQRSIKNFKIVLLRVQLD